MDADVCIRDADVVDICKNPQNQILKRTQPQRDMRSFMHSSSAVISAIIPSGNDSFGSNDVQIQQCGGVGWKVQRAEDNPHP